MAIQEVWNKDKLVSARCPECGRFTKKIKRYPFELRYYRKRHLTSQIMAFCQNRACSYYWEIMTPDSYRTWKGAAE